MAEKICEVSVIVNRRTSQPKAVEDSVEDLIGQPVYWISAYGERVRWRDIGLQPPDLFIQGGHSNFQSAFASLGNDCKRHGGRVVLASDHNWQGTLKQRYLERLRYQLILRKKFDAVFVPGSSGRLYYREMGVAENRIYEGLYGADPAIFSYDDKVNRVNRLLFIGQLIERKNISRLCSAFLNVLPLRPGWILRIHGAGYLAGELPVHESIELRPFIQPTELAAVLRSSRCLILPSKEEHWGLVVHEAALSGCALLLSDRVGSASDLASQGNSILFPPNNQNAIEQALLRVTAWSSKQWLTAEEESRSLATQFGPEKFVRAVATMLNDLLN
jgi:glycosyltransferase involved in cell wall biosynthesis